MKLFEFNLNEEIGVQITDEAHLKAYRRIWSNLKVPPDMIPRYEKPIRDSDGFIWMQAWIFIKDFSYTFTWGGPDGVKTTIRIKKKNLKALVSTIKDVVP